VSPNLAEKIQLGLDELAVIRDMMSPLIARTGEPELPVMETAAACTMLHSFYTENRENPQTHRVGPRQEDPFIRILASRFAKPDGGRD
jgi:hypothetical protein